MNIVELHAPTLRLLAGIIAKYYVQVMLFVYNRNREIFGYARETFLFTDEKTNTGIYIRKRKPGDQEKSIKGNNLNSLMKVIDKSRLFRSLQR